MYQVYCHIFPNEKRYVGITKTSLQKRWGNGKKYKSCPLVNRAIKKYGWENIAHELLGMTSGKEEAEDMERKFILQYNTTNPEYGYNVLPGGDVAENPLTDEMRKKLGNGWRGKHRSKEEKEKIGIGVKRAFSRPESNGRIGKHASQKTKNKMSQAQKSAWENQIRKKNASEKMRKRMNNPELKEKIIQNLSNYKRKKGEWSMPESTKKKLSEKMKGKWIGKNSPTSKPVLQYTKDGKLVKKWACAGEAERAGIALRRNISKCCNNAPHCYTAGGFIWKFSEE